MVRSIKAAGLTVACTLLLAPDYLVGQAIPETSILVELDNFTWYLDDSDPSLYGTLREKLATPANTAFRPLRRYAMFADVVKLDGKTAAGTFFADGVVLNVTHGTDLPRNQALQFVLDIMSPEKEQIGTLYGVVMGSGAAPPGLTQGAGVWAVLGGSGAYVGVRGQGANVFATGLRQTSMREDLTLRRANVGGQIRLQFHLSGIGVPRVLASYHADMTPVTATNPAQSGEVVVLEIGAGWPVRPALDGRAMFGSDPMQIVAIPIEARVNEQTADVVNRIGWPGTRDRYRVDVRLPNGLAPGNASLQVTGAYVPGVPFTLPVR